MSTQRHQGIREQWRQEWWRGVAKNQETSLPHPGHSAMVIAVPGFFIATISVASHLGTISRKCLRSFPLVCSSKKIHILLFVGHCLEVVHVFFAGFVATCFVHTWSTLQLRLSTKTSLGCGSKVWIAICLTGPTLSGSSNAIFSLNCEGPLLGWDSAKGWPCMLGECFRALHVQRAPEYVCILYTYFFYIHFLICWKFAVPWSLDLFFVRQNAAQRADLLKAKRWCEEMWIQLIHVNVMNANFQWLLPMLKEQTRVVQFLKLPEALPPFSAPMLSVLSGAGSWMDVDPTSFKTPSRIKNVRKSQWFSPRWFQWQQCRSQISDLTPSLDSMGFFFELSILRSPALLMPFKDTAAKIRNGRKLQVVVITCKDW